MYYVKYGNTECFKCYLNAYLLEIGFIGNIGRILWYLKG